MSEVASTNSEVDLLPDTIGVRTLGSGAIHITAGPEGDAFVFQLVDAAGSTAEPLPEHLGTIDHPGVIESAARVSGVPMVTDGEGLPRPHVTKELADERRAYYALTLRSVLDKIENNRGDDGETQRRHDPIDLC